MLNNGHVQETFEQALECHRQGEIEQAQALYQEVLRVAPDHAQAMHLSGVIASRSGDHLKAVRLIGRAIATCPDNAAFHFNLGNAYNRLKKFDAALASYDQAISINPDYSKAFTNRGIVLNELKRFDAALESYGKAISIKPDNQEAYSNRGVLLRELRHFDAALENFDKALSINPDFAEAFTNRGILFKELNQLDAALDSFDKAITIIPDLAEAHLNKSLILLLEGDFRRGWELYEWRWKVSRLASALNGFTQPLWLGNESIKGKTIFLYSEQGYGDTIQFCRYASLVADLGAKVILESEMPLTALLKKLEGVSELVARGSTPPDFDYHCPLLSLPLAFKTDLDSIPCPKQYLKSDPEKVAYWKSRLGNKTEPLVGLVWSGNPAHTSDHNRSIPLSVLTKHLPEGFAYVSLQKKVRQSDRPALESNENILHFGDELNDFTDTAALCDLMDVVISVDTSVAHLSGALGKQTWVLLPFAPDWRWMLNRNDSPWYPSMRLFRQQKPNDWDEVFGRLRSALLTTCGKGEGLAVPENQRMENENSAIKPSIAQGNPEIENSNQKHETPNTAQGQAAFEQALECHRRGELEQAQVLYDEVLAMEPDHVNALHLSGVLAAQANNHRKAVELIGKAIAIWPGNATFHCNHGLALNELNEFDAAATSFEKAAAIKHDYHEAYYQRGNALQKLGKFDAAVTSYDKAIAIRPDFAEAYYQRANALQELMLPEAALESYDKAIAIRPDNFKACSNRGVLLHKLRNLDAALESYDKAIAIKPDYYLAYTNRGVLLHELRKFDAALESYDIAISLKPDSADAYYNRGNALHELKRFGAALESYDKAIAIRPDFAEALSNRGNTLHELKQFDAAIESYDKAIAIKPDYPDACWNKSLALLTTGNFNSGWPLYEWRWKKENFTSPRRDFTSPLWLGNESLAGKTILLHSEQGLGDTIQFCRYVESVALSGARVILEAKPALGVLLKNLSGLSELVAGQGPLPDFDYHCPLLSLPLAFKTDLDSIPHPQHYLKSDPDKLLHWKNRLGKKTKPRIGLVWSGGVKHRHDGNRSIPLSTMASHLPEGFTYVSLQKEVRDIDRGWLESNKHILHFDDELEDFSDTAALCDLMEVVISVDTSVAHLNGALGNPTWVLLPFSPDWRWMIDREDSPWYPSMRLFRQQKPDDWSGAFEKLSSALLALQGK
ncbi:MAG: tetratricopeptide repeat protein [Chlorobiaceae bacterium]|nr:tetratricopeptide repeat protein [Chlorobiaceae bacterium]